MLNHKPIFINALARGGSNIIMNLLLSHPNVCISSGETHKVFKGTKWDSFFYRFKKRILYDLPIRFYTGQDIFGINWLEPRKPVPSMIQHYIDRILYYGRFKASIDTHNKYKYENVPYTAEELSECRLLTKGLNGVVFTVDMFNEMYPDAVFFGLIRNGLAICEGYIRRGFAVENIANIYKLVVKKMLDASIRVPNYFLVRYEDMVSDPLLFMQKIYKYADLDINLLRKARIQSKAIMNTNGNRQIIRGQNRQLFWYELEELHHYIRKDINENQIRQLNVKDKQKFISVAGDAMKLLGYQTD